MSDLMPLSLVAQALAVSLSTVSRLVRTGHLPVVKIGRVRRVRQADLERFVSRRLHYFGLGVVKPFFFRSSVLESYRTNSREYYLHESAFHGTLGVKSGWSRRKRGLQPGVGAIHELPLPAKGGVDEFCELPFWKVTVTQEVIVITPKDFRKLPRAIQEHWRKYLILNQDLVVP